MTRFDTDRVDTVYEDRIESIGAELEQQAAVWALRFALALGWLEPNEHD